LVPGTSACITNISLSCVAHAEANNLRAIFAPSQCKPGTSKYACFALQVMLSGGMEHGAPEVPRMPGGAFGIVDGGAPESAVGVMPEIGRPSVSSRPVRFKSRSEQIRVGPLALQLCLVVIQVKLP
jgi:hypothetical protein